MNLREQVLCRMSEPNYWRACLLLCIMIAAVKPVPANAQHDSDSSETAAQVAPPTRDGQRDFDFEIGTWKTHLSIRLNPLSGSTEWVEYEGTSVVRKVWNGRANLVELEADGPAGHIQGLSLRLYNPESRQWSLNFANRARGTMTEPVIGEFKDGRGEFFGQELLNGRVVFVRFVISCSTPDSCRFEQAFSADGGETWETNWIAIDTRINDESDDVH